MARPWTFALLKPDAAPNPIFIRLFLDAIHERGLVIDEGCSVILPPDKASELYKAHENAFFYRRLMRHMCSGPSVAMTLVSLGGLSSYIEPNLAVKQWRNLLGPSKLFPNVFLTECSEPCQLRLKNLRQLFGISDTRNFAHGSGSFEEAQKEYEIFKHIMRKIEDPASELFRLDKYALDDYENGIDEEAEKRRELNLLHE